MMRWLCVLTLLPLTVISCNNDMGNTDVSHDNLAVNSAMTMTHKTKVNWLEWSDSAFKKAQEEDKPILLDISAVWCHWCHVMDETTYSDEDVARIIRSEERRVGKGGGCRG